MKRNQIGYQVILLLISLQFIVLQNGCLVDRGFDLFLGNDLFRIYFHDNNSINNTKKITGINKPIDINIVGKFIPLATRDGTTYQVKIILICKYHELGIVPKLDVSSISVNYNDIDLKYKFSSVWGHDKKEKIISYFIKLSNDSSSNYLEYAYVDCEKPSLHFDLSGILKISEVPIKISPFIAYPCEPSAYEDSIQRVR